VEKFIARPPIFDSARIVCGYELLFRSGRQNYFDDLHPEAAAASSADNLFLFGIDQLTQGHRAFIHCTREFFLGNFSFVLPKDRVVLEILASIVPDDEILAACCSLKDAGYLLALDDFHESPAWRNLTELVAFIKIDVLAAPALEQQRLAKAFSKTGVQLVAEKVESYDVFERPLSWGHSYFQGYSFNGPKCLPATTFLPTTYSCSACFCPSMQFLICRWVTC
jgi:c-di-GMP-related signal transduction protein